MGDSESGITELYDSSMLLWLSGRARQRRGAALPPSPPLLIDVRSWLLQARHAAHGTGTHVLCHASYNKCAFIGALPLDERSGGVIRRAR